jgi:hypothetical protein
VKSSRSAGLNEEQREKLEERQDEELEVGKSCKKE